MTKQYKQIRSFEGLANRRNARDINGLLKAQNVSVDIGGLIKTIGGLETHSEVPTHAAVLCPGAGLYPYGSDHWRGADTIVDLLANNNATADQQTEANATTGWTAINSTLSSDTPANFGIASNGTTYVMELTNGSGHAYQSFSTVIGQRYIIKGSIYSETYAVHLKVGTTTTGGDLYSGPIHIGAPWLDCEGFFIATTITTYVSISSLGTTPSNYADNISVFPVFSPDLDTTWLALADVANAQVDLYNSRDDSFTANLLDFGTVASFVGASAGNVDFPTSNTITDSANSLLNSNFKEGKIYKISGCSTTTANNVLCVCERVTAGTAYFRGHPFTVTASEAGTVTLTEYNPTDFHFVDDSLSVSPVGGGIALRPKQYRFVDRIHLSGAKSSEDKYQNWYLNDIGLPPPTDISAVANNGDQAMGDIGTAGTGLEIGITATADDGEWVEGTYIIAHSFIYDDGQESELYIPSTDEEFGTVIVDNDSLTMTARAKGPYDERISGARFYCRLDETDDPWVLLTDISMADGARATLSGQYNSWNESDPSGSGAINVAYTANFKSKRINVDTYESLTGFNPDVRIEKFTSDNRFYDASVIAGNRTFIFGPRYTDAGGKTVHFRDRILYSKINEYDVFPIKNLIDVTGSDAEDFVVGAVYGNDLLCFKQNTLYIVDISDPLLFRMKQDKQQGKYPFRGISRPAAMFDTPHGIAWCNQFGLWLYNGAEILDLLGDKIERSKHPLAYQKYIHFDGSDDYLSVADDPDLDFGEGDFSVEGWVRTSEVPTVNQAIVSKKNTFGTSIGYALSYDSNGKLSMNIGDSSNSAEAISTGTINNGIFRHVGATISRAGNVITYIDGLADGSASATSIGNVDNSEDFELGAITGASRFSLCDLQAWRVWNRVLTPTEMLARKNGEEIASADQWGQQDIYLSDFSADVDSWTADAGAVAGNIDSIGGENDNLRFTVDGSSSSNHRFSKTGIVTDDTQTNLTFWLYIPSANTDIDGIKVGGAFVGESVTTPTPDTWTLVSVQNSLTDGAVLRINTTKAGSVTFTGNGTDVVYIRLVNLDHAGAVAAWLHSNIPGTHDSGVWPDDSDNDLDIIFSGATPILPDTWEDFWTDYSILGYHGKTNQLIIMRDCTGHYSLGSDYGDAWITDLDTLFSTTGRRIFTAKAAYTNFATDWNGDLIIGRQSGSNIITEKWTDKPQSQAAGLIIIETADMDFGNPAIIDIIDAFTSTYKSSAAQTNPLSYALDLSETWTAIATNFSAAGIWAKYLAKPAAFNCNTIRLRITNPTAGTIEINELVIRHDPQILKLS